MTGFGRSEGVFNNINFSIEIKAVNHRYFEFNCRMPKTLFFLEDKLKKTFQERIFRGKTEVFISMLSGASDSTKISVNNSFVESYVNALKQLKSTYNLAGEISVSDLAGKSDTFLIENKEINEEELTEFIINLANNAIDSFIAMRETEGGSLKRDLLLKLDDILNNVALIEELSPKTLKAYEEKLKERIEETFKNFNLNTSSVNIDEQRILTEVAVFADKIAVDEETVRLRSHIAQMKEILNGDGAVGRKLDFLVQEMNREANTIGSKAQDSDIAKKVIEIKTTIEKIREQIQNIE